MMEANQENSATQEESAEPAEAASLGKMLREARERLGLSVADVAGQTKLAVRQIEALEADDFRSLPEMPFVRGFVRSYAKILQVDTQPLLASMPQSNGDQVSLVPVSVEAPFPSPHSPQRQNLIWLGAALLLSVLVVAIAVWNFTAPPAKMAAVQAEAPESVPDREAAAPATPAVKAAAIVPPAREITQPPAETEQAHGAAGQVFVPHAELQTVPPAVQPVAPPKAAALRLKFDEESWVEIKDKDGKVLSSQVNLPGSELRLNGEAPFSLVIGHAAAVRLYHHGRQVDLASHINPENEVARLTLE